MYNGHLIHLCNVL